MDERQVTRFLGYGRIVIGTLLVLAPGQAGGRWFGPVARDPAVKAAVRALGVRDAVLGAGAVHALDTGRPVQTWVQAGAMADVVDAVASLLAVRTIGARRALPAIAVAGTAAVLGVRIASNVD
jgi:hypothetical protein